MRAQSVKRISPRVLHPINLILCILDKRRRPLATLKGLSRPPAPHRGPYSPSRDQASKEHCFGSNRFLFQRRDHFLITDRRKPRPIWDYQMRKGGYESLKPPNVLNTLMLFLAAASVSDVVYNLICNVAQSFPSREHMLVISVRRATTNSGTLGSRYTFCDVALRLRLFISGLTN